MLTALSSTCSFELDTCKRYKLFCTFKTCDIVFYFIIYEVSTCNGICRIYDI